MTDRPLTVDQLSSVTLNFALVVYLIITAAVGPLSSGTVDIYSAAGLFFIVPYLIFAYFGRKAKAWAYLGSSVLSAGLIVVTAFSIEPGESTSLIWVTAVSTILFSLVSLEGFKGYLQSKEGISV